MAKKIEYMPRVIYSFGHIPYCEFEPITVEEYQRIEKKYFSVLDEKPKPPETEDKDDQGFLSQFKYLQNIEKIFLKTSNSQDKKFIKIKEDLDPVAIGNNHVDATLDAKVELVDTFDAKVEMVETSNAKVEMVDTFDAKVEMVCSEMNSDIPEIKVAIKKSETSVSTDDYPKHLNPFEDTYETIDTRKKPKLRCFIRSLRKFVMRPFRQCFNKK